MNCNLTNEERKTKKARCRSWDCSACNNFYTNCLNEEIIKLNRQLEIAVKALRFYNNHSNWAEIGNLNYGIYIMMLNEKDTTLVDGKIVGGFIAKMALDDLESAGE